MSSARIRQLRAQLATRLRRVLRNPVIEAKELAAFDLIMSRRSFLKASQLAGVSALVMAGVPPTVWARARRDPALKVCPRDVGLSDAEQASVTVAAQVISGTELFQDTVYAQPVVSQAAVETHAVIEGARGRARIQSDLLSTNPDELQFLDRDFHYGPPELIQLEQDPETGDWELVHYYHPWEGRTDGTRTDGLVRQVIMDKSDGLVDPTRVLAVTGGYANYIDRDGETQLSSARYMLYVEGASQHVVFGTAVSSVQAPYDELPAHPTEWTPVDLSRFKLGSDFLFADTLTSSAWLSSADNHPPDYFAARQVEHLVLYYTSSIAVVTLADFGPRFGNLKTSAIIANHLPLPAGSVDARVVHVDWDPTTAANYQIENIVLASSAKQSNGDVTYSLYSLNQAGNATVTFSALASAFNEIATVSYANAYQARHTTIPAAQLENGDLELDYASIRNVRGLHTTITDGNWYHVKLVNFEGRGIGLLGITKEGPPEQVGSSSDFYPGGHFPLVFPDAAGLGTVTRLSGGTSKFGGFRFVVSDEDGNLFLMRQRSYEDAETPYKPPIYGLNTATGEPIASWSATPLPVPDGTAPASNLNDLAAWVEASAPGLGYVHNFLLDAALAFGTDDSNVSQAIWLGNQYQAAYALNRFSLDSQHVAIKRAQGSDDSDETYAAYMVYKEPVTRTWRQRQIASQVVAKGLGLQETGDHYQATLTPANAYGKPVSLLSPENQNLVIEVRADSPCTVVDDTNNLYYDVDRYTSFMATPDPATGHLALLVKADVFSQVLYARVVDTSGLQPSDDAALLASSQETAASWQSMNLAAEAQQRMGNGAAPSSLLGDDAPVADTTQYVSSATLVASNQQTPWQTKGGYSPSSSNLDGLASYLNTSGQNLVSATGQLSLGAPGANGTIDPLYAVTVVPSDPERDTVTTQFAYDSGQVTTTSSPPSLVLPDELGNFWKSISHALHDALHWLQNVEGDAYKDLASGGVKILSAVDGITVSIGKDIMKQVNGVEEDLDEVVSTVEEYASVVANVIVTVVEQTFLYKFIALIIALISLFIYFQDILDLTKSFGSYFKGVFDGGLPQVSSTFDSSSGAAPFLGPGNTLSSTLGGVDSSGVPGEVVATIFDAVLSNPLSKKILNKLMSLASKALNEATPDLPFSFDLDPSVADSALSDLDGFVTQIEQAVENLAVSVATQLVEDVADDLANPQATYQTLGSQLGGLVEGVATEVLDDMFGLLDTIAREGPQLAHDLVSQDGFIQIDTTVLADLCHLFGLGDPVGDEVSISAADAVFFPIAAIAWVAVYEQEGRTIKSVSDLEGSLSLPAGELGSLDTTLWNFIRIIIDGVMQTLLGFVWFVNALNPPGGQLNPAEKLFVACGSWFGLARWINDFSYSTYSFVHSSALTFTKDYDYGETAFRLYTAALDTVLTLPGRELNTGEGWSMRDPKPTDITQAMNFIVHGARIGIDTVEAIEAEPTANEILDLVGVDVFRSQLVFVFIYNLFSLKSSIEYIAPCVLTTPIIGMTLQIVSLLLEGPLDEGGSGKPGHCGRGHARGHGRGRGHQDGHSRGRGHGQGHDDGDSSRDDGTRRGRGPRLDEGRRRGRR